MSGGFTHRLHCADRLASDDAPVTRGVTEPQTAKTSQHGFMRLLNDLENTKSSTRQSHNVGLNVGRT